MKRELICWHNSVHNSNNISEGEKGRKATITENEELLQQNEDTPDFMNLPFKKAELNCALRKTCVFHREKIKYVIMINHLSKSGKDIYKNYIIKFGKRENYPSMERGSSTNTRLYGKL